MKSLDQIQQDFENEGFECIGGKERGKGYQMREFKRSEGLCAFSVIRVSIFNQDIDEVEEELEPEEREGTFALTPEELPPVYGRQAFSVSLERHEERAYILGRLAPRYPYEIIKSILSGDTEAPLWLQNEIWERRRGKNE